MSIFKKALIYLGLGPDEEYEFDDAAAASSIASAPVPAVGGAQPGSPAVGERSGVQPLSGTVRPIAPSGESSSAHARPSASEPSTAPRARGGSPGATSAIRIVEATAAKPHAVSPGSFNEAQEIGDRFKSGQPVIVNLQGVDKDLRRRLVDFASGLCYALAGKMDRVADQVYLLTPADVEVSQDDTRRALD